MNTSAIIFMVMGITVICGGLAICLGIAIKNK